MKLLICLIGLFCVTGIYAQDSIPKIDESKNFLYFYGGLVNYIDGAIRIKSPWFKSSYFEVNGQKFDIGAVQFYKNGVSFYGNTFQANQRNVFARRVLKGKVNYYEGLTEVSSAPMMNANGMYMGGGSYTKTTRYYNKGFGPLKRAKYQNLIEDLVDNQESVLLLQKYNKVRKKEILVYIISGIATVAGLLTAFEGTGEYEESYNFETNRYETTEKQNIKPLNLTIGLVGMITGTVNYFKSKKKYEYLEDAIYTYNK